MIHDELLEAYSHILNVIRKHSKSPKSEIRLHKDHFVETLFHLRLATLPFLSKLNTGRYSKEEETHQYQQSIDDYEKALLSEPVYF